MQILCIFVFLKNSLCIFVVYFMYILCIIACIFHVYFMDILCIFCVNFMYICIFYV